MERKIIGNYSISSGKKLNGRTMRPSEEGWPRQRKFVFTEIYVDRSEMGIDDVYYQTHRLEFTQQLFSAIRTMEIIYAPAFVIVTRRATHFLSRRPLIRIFVSLSLPSSSALEAQAEDLFIIHFFPFCSIMGVTRRNRRMLTPSREASSSSNNR